MNALKRFLTRPVPAFVVALIVLVVGVVMFYWVHPEEKTPAPIQAIAKATPPAAPKPAVEEVKHPTFAEQLAVATVKKDEGIEHPLIRQLMADPTQVTDPKEKFGGDVKDQKALKRWAGWEAHRIAIKAGYFDWKFGAEIYVYPDVIAFLIQKNPKDGRLHVAEYTAVPGDTFGTHVITRELASSFSDAKFLGWPDDFAGSSMPSYEHVHVLNE